MKLYPFVVKGIEPHFLHLGFESSVVLYGIVSVMDDVELMGVFESSVVLYGIVSTACRFVSPFQFESSVVLYGIVSSR